MQSIRYTHPGDSSVLDLVEREPATPGPGEVRVRVHVSGVNPTDWKRRAGTGRPIEFDEVTPNQDGAGVVDAVGDGVTSIAVGDRVWLHLAQHERASGTAQELTVVPQTRVAALPDGVDFAVGAALGVPALTAHRALTVHEAGPTRLGPSALAHRTVLVQGGAGAVGNAAIQLAVWSGATVIATVSSPEKAALARAAGAHHVVQYPDPTLADQIRRLAPAGVDHVVEVSPARNAELDLAVVANHGSIAYYATDNGATYSTPISPNLAKNVRWQGVLLYTLSAPALATGVADVTEAVAAGAFRIGTDAGLPLTWYRLEQTAAAHDAVETGTVGKVLIRVVDDV